MVGWEQPYMISFIGGAFVFAFIASTIRINEVFNNAIKLFFYLISMAMVLGALGSNYAIINSVNSTLLNTSGSNLSNVGSALNGVFIAVLITIVMVFLLLLIFSMIAVVMSLKKKKKIRQFGEEPE